MDSRTCRRRKSKGLRDRWSWSRRKDNCQGQSPCSHLCNSVVIPFVKVGNTALCVCLCVIINLVMERKKGIMGAQSGGLDYRFTFGSYIETVDLHEMA